MRIVCQYMILIKYQTFFWKWRKMPQNMLSAAVVIGTLFCLFDLVLYIPSTIFHICRDGYSGVEPVLS